MKLSHTDSHGKARMVDISAKKTVKRTAIAAGKIALQKTTLDLIMENNLQKGDVLAVARIAAIQGAKHTSNLIPLCHPLPIDSIDIKFDMTAFGIEIVADVVSTYKTGVEMEALTAVSVAALTIYDMCKAADKTMIISDIKLVKKTKEEIEALH